MARFRLLWLFGCLLLLSGAAQSAAQELDSDHDGLSDALEQRLLEQFRPQFRVGERDCAGAPAAFEPGMVVPTPVAEDGTIYGQVFALKGARGTGPRVEAHFYHLWARDCGAHGHPLDTEHVAVLLEASDRDLATAHWTATYWYAAAHENTVCDVSQVTRAATLHAEDRGAVVWISPGKHASYLDVSLCNHGCGADRCEEMKVLPRGRVVNLGEVAYPMNQSSFVGSSQWPLAAKMELTNFNEGALGRAGQLGTGQIGLYNPGRHPMQGVIAISASTEEAIAESGGQTGGALGEAGDKTGGALATSADKTGDALGRSYASTRHALGSSARHVGKALRLRKGETEPAPPPPQEPQKP